MIGESVINKNKSLQPAAFAFVTIFGIVTFVKLVIDIKKAKDEHILTQMRIKELETHGIPKHK